MSDSEELKRLGYLIEQKRKRLYALNEENRPMVDKEMIKASQSLDQLITQHMLLKKRMIRKNTN